jgi:hypothetical protein
MADIPHRDHGNNLPDRVLFLWIAWTAPADFVSQGMWQRPA